MLTAAVSIFMTSPRLGHQTEDTLRGEKESVMMCHVSFVGEALKLRRTKREKHIKENIFKVLKFPPLFVS